MPRSKGINQDESKSSKKKSDDPQQLGVAVPVDNEDSDKQHKSTKSSSKKTPTKGIASAGVKKTHRFRPGTVVAREIKQQQKSTTTIIPRRPFDRLVREIIQDVAMHTVDARIQKTAMDALHAASEDFLTGLFTDVSRLADEKKKVTIYPNDMRLVATLNGKMARSLREYIAQIEYNHRAKNWAIMAASKKDDVTGLDEILQKKDTVTKVDPQIHTKANVSVAIKS
jgi:histone H3